MLTDDTEINATSALDKGYMLQHSTYFCWNQYLWRLINPNDSGTQNCSFKIDMCCLLDIKGHDRLFIIHRRKKK